MTTDAPTPLPGLPTPPEPEGRELTQGEICVLNLRAAVEQLVEQARMDSPDLQPPDAAAAIGEIVGKTMVTIMPPGAARMGLLVAFEQSHDEPMSFVRINQTKTALERLADRRRRRDKVTTGGLIVPGKD